MEKLARVFYLIFAIGVAASSAWAASPCDSVDRSLTNKRKVALAPEIARQLDASSVNVLQSFRTGDWSIIYVDSHSADDAFLFFAQDPLTHHYITLWSGAAVSNEEEEIKDWTLKNAPGIPPKLANCFAWHVTHDRGK
jgi:hypothetical protein